MPKKKGEKRARVLKLDRHGEEKAYKQKTDTTHIRISNKNKAGLEELKLELENSYVKDIAKIGAKGFTLDDVITWAIYTLQLDFDRIDVSVNYNNTMGKILKGIGA